MPLNAELKSLILNRFARIRTGLTVGFGDDSVLEDLREARGGLWLSVEEGRYFPFENAQFEVVVLHPRVLDYETIREINRILIPAGSVFFSVEAKTHKHDGWTVVDLYRLVRRGFDIVAIIRPNWYKFGFGEQIISVCLRKKTWRSHKGFVRDGAVPFTPFKDV